MAYVLSSVSGNLISAASAGFAPTISADVSAIASAYQVVSATATQLNAGTVYLTSVNDTPLSAARAGNAANASLANSAWYDGTGRLISALPDEATVSSIASAYAESAASSKMDESSISAYVPFSAVSADENSAITSINGSSVGGGNEITAAYRVVTYDPELDVSSTSTATGTATGFSVIHQTTAAAKGTASTVYAVQLNGGTALDIAASQLRVGTWQTGGNGSQSYPYYWLSFSPSLNAFPGSACTGYLGPCQWATGAGIMMSAGYFRGMLKANELFLSRESVLDASTTTSFQGWYIRSEAHNSRGAHIGFTATNRSGGQYTGTGNTAFYTASADIGSTGVTFNNFRYDSSASKTTITTGGVTVSSTSTASSTSYMRSNRSSIYFSANDTSDTGTGSSYAYYGLSGITFEDSASTSTIDPSSIGYWNAKLDSSAIECDTASVITAIGGSAIAGGGVDEATVSAIASAYADPKQDTSAMTAYVEKTAYDDLYSAFTALSGVISTYSAYFSSISAKVDNSAIGVIE